MKKLFSDEIYDILDFEGGFIVVYRRNEVEDKIVVSYKSVLLNSGVVSQRTRTDYQFVKFGDLDPTGEFKSGEFITCSTAKLENGSLFVVTKNGDAKIFDSDGIVEWQGTIKYKECGPASIAHSGHTLWASSQNVTL